MKQSSGSVYMFNFIILFIIIVFAFLAGIISYNRAFKVNSRIINAIERHEGYNRYAIEEINNVLSSIGYNGADTLTCPKKNGYELKTTNAASTNKFEYCVYRRREENTAYSTYLVTSYIYMNVPLVNNLFKIPVSSRTNRIYIFSSEYK
ncbi:MAG: hypothetical protein KH135_02770 [Firmicutes bacterium]|nr:hypothetical protein [Bacillota bacterium]